MDGKVSSLVEVATNPQTMQAVQQLAEQVVASKLFKDILSSPQEAFVLMQLCVSRGLAPMEAVTRYHIIKGKPSMRADAMQAEFQANGGRIEWKERTEKCCEAVFSHPSGGTVPVKWTIEMAKTAGLTGNPSWAKYPRQMLHARCVSEGVRATFPGAVSGIYTPEEVRDFDPAPAEPKPVAVQVKDEKPTRKPRKKAKPDPWTDGHQEIMDVLDANGFQGMPAMKKLSEVLGREIKGLQEIDAAECANVKDLVVAHFAKAHSGEPTESHAAALNALSKLCKDKLGLEGEQIKVRVEGELGRSLGAWTEVTEQEATDLFDKLSKEDIPF